MKFARFFTVVLISAVMIASGCATDFGSSADTSDSHAGHAHAASPAVRASAITKAVAVMYPTDGNTCKGIVTFTQTSKGVHVVAKITGLGVSQKHAIHIHEFGDTTSGDGKSTGGHYNPEGHDHALPSKGERHAGDLGNLKSNANGEAHYEITVTNITIAGSHNPIVGRGVIIHAKPDDGGQPTGNAGARISAGTISIAKSN